MWVYRPALYPKVHIPPRSKNSTQCLLGEKQPRIEAEDGMAAVQIAEAAIQSAATGKAVTLELLTEVLS